MRESTWTFIIPEIVKISYFFSRLFTLTRTEKKIKCMLKIHEDMVVVSSKRKLISNKFKVFNTALIY